MFVFKAASVRLLPAPSSLSDIIARVLAQSQNVCTVLSACETTSFQHSTPGLMKGQYTPTWAGTLSINMNYYVCKEYNTITSRYTAIPLVLMGFFLRPEAGPQPVVVSLVLALFIMIMDSMNVLSTSVNI